MWWWIADVLGAGVLIPSLAVSLWQLARPVAAIDRHLAHMLDDLTAVVGALDAIPDLAETVMLTDAGKAGVQRYRDALRAMA